MRSIDPDVGLLAAVEEPDMEQPPLFGTDERRMHVRAYNFWVSLLGGRAFPAVADLDPARAADFSSNAVLLDFTASADNPAIRYLGETLRDECGPGHAIETIEDVPPRSLLSRLTDHYLQILANRAPIGFEAEFVSQRGYNTLYRGILMPFSSDGATIDFVFGVINWKEIADPALVAGIAREMAASAPALPPVWADGPCAASATSDPTPELDDAAPELDEDEPALADRLATARVLAEEAQRARLKSRAALYRALGLAYDFSLAAAARPDDYAELLDDAGLKVQQRAPMTAIVKLIFGTQLEKARATEFAAALAQAHRCGLPLGGFTAHIESRAGGLKAMVAAERAARRPEHAPRPLAERARAALRRLEPRVTIDLPSDGAEFVLLIARREGDGRLAVLAPVPGEDALLDRAIRKIAH